MVISHASIPHIFLHLYSPELPEQSAKEIESAVLQSLLEITRVLKSGKKAYLSPIIIAENYESQRIVKKAILDALGFIRKIGIKTDFKLIKIDINPKNGEKSEHYRLIIEKPLRIINAR